MKIVIVTDWFAEKMGYAENCLPKALAALGHDVHVVTSNVQPYFNTLSYRQTYEPFLGPGIVECGVKTLDGYTLHRLPHSLREWRVGIRGVIRTLWRLRPDIVQVFDTANRSTYQVALASRFIGYRLFLGFHRHASVFPPATQWGGLRQRLNWLVYAATLGRMVSRLSEKCYAISRDAADVAIEFFGVEARKCEIMSLGVDTALFRPVSGKEERESRQRLRTELGFVPMDVVCIYTGRFTDDKNPLCLADAIDRLVEEGRPFSGLFVGEGPQVEAIRMRKRCKIHPFVAVSDLPPFYWASDIGVWPKQESTSQLDAAASGLPIVVSNRVTVRERVEGNGLFFEEDNPADLARQLVSLSEGATRLSLGESGARKVRGQFGWDRIATQRIEDYRASLAR